MSQQSPHVLYADGVNERAEEILKKDFEFKVFEDADETWDSIWLLLERACVSLGHTGAKLRERYKHVRWFACMACRRYLPSHYVDSVKRCSRRYAIASFALEDGSLCECRRSSST